MTRPAPLRLALLLAAVTLPALVAIPSIARQAPPAADLATQSNQTQDSQTKDSQAAMSDADQALLLSMLDSTLFGADSKAAALAESWTPAFVPAAIEIHNFVGSAKLRQALMEQLVQETGQDFGTDMNRWYRWQWNEPAAAIAGYDDFKAAFYRRIDPRFGRYFADRGDTARIRLDEIRWGGVQQDGIPPLRNPKMLSASEADYLDDADVVFGIEVNGDVRAYPKRILAWHEMFTDRVGGVDVAGVYCTLCGTVILYDTVHDGTTHELGTSGFLYRSNKLMYDQATQSLWNTIKGEPVLGPLADSGIALDHRSVVTTTWGQWKARHPGTQVLSLETGHRRDYREGVAYHDYFADDALMFNTPFTDTRLNNKTEVLALRFKTAPGKQVAISTDFLANQPVYSSRLGAQDYVVLTDPGGANRVYDPKGKTIIAFDGAEQASALDGTTYQLTEAKLIGSDGTELPRLPYHRAFWFGWHASYPNSDLVK